MWKRSSILIKGPKAPQTLVFTPLQSRLFWSQFPRETEKKPKVETEFEQALEEAKKEAFAVKSEQDQQQLVAKKKPLVERIKEELMHYWHGSKLLAAETKISSRLLLKVLKGKELSRREYRQLKRTTGDLLRLVPLVVILVVPFLEFALPFLLKLFPSMLPSTFESKGQEEERKRNLLMVRLKMAKFLQETVAEVSLSGTGKQDAAKEFHEFFSKCRMTGEPATTEDIVRVARKFKDELTLTNLSRPQLVSLARFMNLNAFGTDSFLRSTIENRLKELKQDDFMIVKDGVDSLTISELQHACSARGITTFGTSPARMRAELHQWLELHLEHKIPSSLLLLSHAFQTSTRVLQPGTDALDSKAPALQAALSSLPHQVINEASLKVSEQEGVATYKQKLDVLKEQEELIADELEQQEAEDALKRAKLEDEETAKKVKEEELKKADSIKEVEPVEFEQPPEIVVEPIATDKDTELSEEETKKLADALKTISKEPLEQVKETLNELKEDRQEFKEDVEEFKQFTQKETPSSSERLGTRVDKMIDKIEKELTKYDTEIVSKLKFQPDLEEKISIQDLEKILRIIEDNPNDERISKIIAKLDSDNDGLVAMHEIRALAEKMEATKEQDEAKTDQEKA